MLECNERNDVIKSINQEVIDSGLYELEYQAVGKQFYKCTYSDIEAFNLYKLK